MLAPAAKWRPRLVPQAQPLTRREKIWFFIVLASALGLRLLDLLIFHPHAPDEGFSLDLAQMPWRAMVAATAADTHPPLYYALLKLWFMLAPRTLAWAQGLSLVFAAGWLWITFRLGRDLFSPAAGWAALACSALAPYQIFWMHPARMHQLLPVAVGIVIWSSYHYLAHPAARWWWILAAAWIVAIQTDYMGLLFGVPWGLAFLILEPAPVRARLRLALATLPGLLCFAPWVAVMARQVAHGPMNHPFTQETVGVVYLYYHAIFGVMQSGPLMWYQPNQAGAPFLIGLLAFALVAVAGYRAVGARWSWWALLFFTPWLPIRMVHWFGWTLAERHLLFCLPAFMAYWGAGIVEARRVARERVGRGGGLPAAVPNAVSSGDSSAAAAQPLSPRRG